MPGTSDPVLGSDALTLAVACAAGVLVAAAPVVLRASPPRDAVLAFYGGLAYASLGLAAWAGARVVTDAFVDGMTASAGTFLGWTLAAAVVLGAQAGVPYYLYARWRLVAPLAALFVGTVLILPAFLGVRGESDPLALYVIPFGPLLVGGTCLVGLVEFAVRRFALGGV